MLNPLTMLVLVYGFMLVEARRAARNERTQRRRGGIEPRGDVYAIMRVAYPGAFALMFGEAISIRARRTFAPFGNSPARIRAKSARFPGARSSC